MSWLLEYPGWGTFRLTVPGGPRVVVDPCITPLLDDPHARRDQVDADVVLLTHGHHEHIRDTHRIGWDPSVPIVAPPQVIDYLVGRRKMDPQLFHCIEPDGSVSLDGLRVTARSFPHLEKHDVAGKLRILRRDNLLGALGLLLRFGGRILESWQVIKDQPEEGPYLAYDLEFAQGGRVFFSCEAFTHLLPASLALAWGAGPHPIDLAVIGVESGQEHDAAALLDALAPRAALAAAVHAPFERFYGKPSVLPDAVISRTGVPCGWIRGGESRRGSLGRG